MSTPRIYADFNGLVGSPKNPERTAVVLDTFGSLRDLANAGIILREGLPLITFDESDDEEDLEGHGTAEYDTHRKWWVVEFDEQGVRRVPAKDRKTVTEFNCVSCGKSLVDHSDDIKTGANCGMVVHKDVLKLVDSCPYCGTPIHAPIAPPNQ